MTSRARLLAMLFLAAALAPVALLLAALYAYDPLQVYHPAWGRPPTVHKNMRLQAIGAIRHGDFDGAILATSILENSSADEAGALLGGRFVNLSISAGDFFERGLILDRLLERRHLRRVIYSLDFIYLNQRKGYRVFPLPTFDFLYDGNPLNDFRVYLNGHFLACLARWSGDEACVGRPVGFDRPNAWSGEPEHAARFGGFDRWCAARDNYQIRDVQEKLTSAARRLAAGDIDANDTSGGDNTARAIAYIEDNLLARVTAHPETEFDLVLPPYSRAKFAIWYQQQTGNADTHQAVVRHIAGRATQLANLRLWGFEDADFPDDIAHYKDLDHFGPEINRRIVEAIRDGRHRITAANVEAYLAEARRRGRAYDLIGLASRLDECVTGGR